MPPGQINGITPTSYVDPGNTQARVIQDGPCQLFSWALGNIATTARFLKLHDIAAAQTSGVTGSPPAFTLIIPGAAGGGGSNNSPAVLPFGGIQFRNGMVAITTTGPLATDVSAAGIAEVVISLGTR